MSFLFPSLLWIGLPLVAGPILIHLLNLRRQRRVKWAAMEFLLESNRRNRRWVNLRQWLLLASRVAVVALAALMLAGPRVAGNLVAWFTAERVHHVIILDDSYSMSDAGAQTPVWDDALAAVSHVIESASRNPQHRVSVLRTTDAASSLAASPETAEGRDALAGLAERAKSWRPTQSSADLSPALAAAARYIASETIDQPVVAYAVSDFRGRNVEPVDRFNAALSELGESADAVHLTPCAEAGSENLAVTELKLLPGARVADLELTAEVTVTNFGASTAKRVTAVIDRDGRALPAAEIGDIPPRESRSCIYPVRFDGAGDHTLVATIEGDAVDADNRRYLATDLPAERSVLLVDGSPGGHEGLAFAAALRPSGVSTGWRPVRVGANELGKAGPLEEYAAVLLLDAPRLAAGAAASIGRYRSLGGGLFLSLGESTDRRHYNRLILGERDAAIVPVRLDLPTQLAPGNAGEGADIRVADHPLFRVFAGDRNSFLDVIAVNYYHGLQPIDGPASDRVRAIASLRNGAPLVIERTRGSGRAVCLLTAATRRRDAVEGWSDIGVSPVFPVLANELVAYLAAPRMTEPQPTVWRPWADADLGPLKGTAFRVAKEGQQPGKPTPPSESGIYRVTPIESGSEAKLLAVNVDPAEGDLSGPSVEELREQVSGAGASVTTLAELRRSGNEASHAPLARVLGALVLALLLCEKLLAARCSYLPATPARANA